MRRATLNSSETNRHDGAFVRFKEDAMEKPTSVSFCKKKQGVQLKPDMLSPVTLDKRLNCFLES